MPENIKVISSNDAALSGEAQGGFGADNVLSINTQQIDASVEEVANIENTLPGKQKKSGINWLGSSYSGVDIKVVAHLYGAIEAEKEEAQYNEELALIEELVDGYAGIITDASGIDASMVAGRGSFEIISSRFSGGSSEMINHLTSFITAFGKYPPGKRTSEITISAQANLDFYSSQAESMRDISSQMEDIRAKASSTLTLATLQTISVQSHRQKGPVRAFGVSDVKGWTRGYRTVAGSMIFTMFNEHALAQLMRAMGRTVNKYGDPKVFTDNQLSTLLADQLPPIDITIIFANEYGSLSRAALYGVEFLNDGYTLSIEDLLTEEVINFVARDVDSVVSAGNINLQRGQRGMNSSGDGTPLSGSKLLFTDMDSYNAYLEKIKVRRSLRNR